MPTMNGVSMPTRRSVKIAPELHRQLAQFRRTAEAVFGENTPGDEVSDLVVGRGLDSLLRDLLTQPEQDDKLAVKTLIAMARVNPDFVYGFLARATDIGSGIGGLVEITHSEGSVIVRFMSLGFS